MKAVFFDVDDTLIDYDKASRAAMRGAVGEVDFALWVEMSDPHFARYGRGEVGFEQMRMERMAHFLELSGRDPAEAEQLERARFDALGTSYELFDDVWSCLHELRRQGLMLGVITNNEPAHQRNKLSLVDLLDSFDTLVISGAVGFAKPDPQIFAYACAELGVTPAEALHVGDRLDLDAVAASAAGLTGVWLDRAGISDAERSVPVVRDLAGLAALVRSLDGG